MCRSIRPLYNYDPPSSSDDVKAAALQFVRKISGYRTPSKVNREAFEKAVDEIAETSSRLLEGLVTASPPRNREKELERARAKRYLID